MEKFMKKTSGAGKVAGVLGLAAGVVAAAAAGYYFYGKGGKAHRKQASAWSKSAKLEMLKKIKRMKSVSKAAYHKASDEVMAKYKQVKNIDPKELQLFGRELKAHWAKISKDALKLANKNIIKKPEAKK